MTDTNQSEALRLALMLDGISTRSSLTDKILSQAAAELRRLQAEIEALRAIADGKQMQGRVPADGCDWFDIYPDQAIGAIASDYSMDIRIKPDVAGAFSAGAALSTAAQPPAGIWVPTELAERVQETMGEFLMDHGWRQQDMDTSDEFGALLAVATKAEPAPPDYADAYQGRGRT